MFSFTVVVKEPEEGKSFKKIYLQLTIGQRGGQGYIIYCGNG